MPERKKSIPAEILKIYPYITDVNKMLGIAIPDLKVVWSWVIDNYSRIGASSSLENYWRVLQVYDRYILNKHGRPYNDNDIKEGNVLDYPTIA